MNIDPTLAQFVAWALGFLFTALIAVLVFLAKTVMSKIDTIVKNQEADAVERVAMKKDIDSIKTDMNTVKTEIKDISEIKQKIIRIETDEKHISADMIALKEYVKESTKKLSELSEKVLSQEQTINQLQKQL